MSEGDYFTIHPETQHRILAKTDLEMLEVSTPEVDDVIRIEDDSNRPSGKIDFEHQK
jgi:quercetin dioxygenase-like cupin family protein